MHDVLPTLPAPRSMRRQRIHGTLASPVLRMELSTASALLAASAAAPASASPAAASCAAAASASACASASAFALRCSLSLSILVTHVFRFAPFATAMPCVAQSFRRSLNSIASSFSSSHVIISSSTRTISSAKRFASSPSASVVLCLMRCRYSFVRCFAASEPTAS